MFFGPGFMVIVERVLALALYQYVCPCSASNWPGFNEWAEMVIRWLRPVLFLIVARAQQIEFKTVFFCAMCYYANVLQDWLTLQKDWIILTCPPCRWERLGDPQPTEDIISLLRCLLLISHFLLLIIWLHLSLPSYHRLQYSSWSRTSS